MLINVGLAGCAMWGLCIFETT